MHVLGGTNQKFDEYQTWYELNFASAVAGGVAGTWKRNLGVDTNVGNGRYMHSAAVAADTMWVFGGVGQSAFKDDFIAYPLRDA